MLNLFAGWKKELEGVERKVAAYRILRKRALQGKINDNELKMLIGKNLERRVKSTRTQPGFPFDEKFPIEKIPGNEHECRFPSPLGQYSTQLLQESDEDNVCSLTSLDINDMVLLGQDQGIPPPKDPEITLNLNLITQSTSNSMDRPPLLVHQCERMLPDHDSGLDIVDSYQLPPSIFSGALLNQPVESLDELVCAQSFRITTIWIG